MPDTPSPDDLPASPLPSRRRFLRRVGAWAGAAAATAGAGVLLTGCSEPGDGAASDGSSVEDGSPTSSSDASTNQCVEPSALSQEAREGRERYNYVAQTPEAGLRCDNCQFWIAAEAGQTCGGCRLFPGPVHPAGYCDSYLAG